MVELSEIPLASHPELLLPTLVFLLLVATRHHIIDYFTPKPLPGFPHLPSQVPFLGDAITLGQWRAKHNTLSAWFDEVARQLIGPGTKDHGEGICQVMFGSGMGSRQLILTDAREAEDILVRRTAEFDRAQVSIDIFGGLLPFGQIALPTNAMWKHHRRILGPSMTSKNLARFAPRAWKFAEELVVLWRAKAELARGVAAERAGKEGRKVHPMFETRADMSFAFSDAISDIAFGEPYHCVRDAIDQVKSMDAAAFRTDAMGAVVFETKGPAVYVASQALLGSLPFTSPFPKLNNFYNKWISHSSRRDRSIVHRFLDRRIAAGRAQAIERGEERAELADTALDLCCLKEGGPDSLSNEAMESELFQFLVAGEETSATTMSWFVKYMGRNPDVQRKLRKELLDAGFDQSAPTFASVQADKTPYLEAVVHETLRLATTAGAVNRRALVDTVVLGRVVPKGVNVLVPLGNLQTRPLKDYAIKSAYEEKRSDSSRDSHSDKKTGGGKPWKEWKDPIKFDPDRWLDGAGKFDRDAGTSWPFSIGQRGCFGKALAVLELKLFVAALNLAFFFEAIPAELDTDNANEWITKKPTESYARLTAWGVAAA